MKTCQDWVAEFKADFFNRGGTTTTWASEYEKVFKFLPSSDPLTPAVLHELVKRSTPNTRTRVRFCMAANKLSKFAEVDYNANAYKGKYKPSHPRKIPDDRIIVETWSEISNPGWRWVIAMMSTYGLRNHEVFRLDLDVLRSGDSVVQVLAGKTGHRQVWPFHPEWVERFDLVNVTLPKVDVNRPNAAVGHSVTEYFAGIDCPFAPYDLRHAYAVRTLTYQIDPSIAARFMGHSREVHEEVYRYWIDRATLQREFDRALNRSDRPRPPAI